MLDTPGCPVTSQTDCGTKKNNKFCSGHGNAIYCDEALGKCGSTRAYRDAQTSSVFDAASIPKHCLGNIVLLLSCMYVCIYLFIYFVASGNA